jgi:DNA primase
VNHVLKADALGWTAKDAFEWMRAQNLMRGRGDLALNVEVALEFHRARSFQLPSGVRQTTLASWPTPAIRYVETRHIFGHQIRRWNIGYAVDGRLSGRIVFPVYNEQNQLASYSARTFTGAQPRYLTPSASEFPDEGVLFGEQFWPRREHRSRIVVVEGAIKALSVERAVGGYVAGVLGATQAKNPRIASKLSTFSEVVILLDDDAAGDEAAQVLHSTLARHVKARRVKTLGIAVDDAPMELIQRACS